MVLLCATRVNLRCDGENFIRVVFDTIELEDEAFSFARRMQRQLRYVFLAIA